MNKTRKWQFIYLASCLTVLSIIPLRGLRVDLSIERLFAPDDRNVQFFHNFQTRFHAAAEDQSIFIGLKNRNGIFQQDFLRKVDLLTRHIAGLEHIEKVYSLTNSNLIFFSDSQVNARPLIHVTQPALYAGDSAYLFQSKEYRDLLVSKDGRSIAVAAFNNPEMTNGEKDQLVNAVRKKVDSLRFDEVHFTGRTFVEQTVISEIKKKVALGLLVLYLLIGVLFVFLLRSLKAALVPVLIIVLAAVWTLAIMSVFKFPVDLVTGLIPFLLPIVTIPSIVQVSMRCHQEVRNDDIKELSIRTIRKDIVQSQLVASLSTSICFFALAISNVLPLKTFGIFMGAGILISFLFTLILFPAWYTPSSILQIKSRDRESLRWTKFFAGCFTMLVNNRKLVLALFAALSLGSIYFVLKIEIGSGVLKELPTHHQITRDIKFAEANFAGPRQFEMVLTTQNKTQSFFDVGLMKNVEAIENFIRDSCHARYIISPISLFKGANKAFNQGKNSAYLLPPSRQQVARFYEAIMQTEHAYEMERYQLPDGSELRISGKLPDLSPNQFRLVCERFDRFFKAGGIGSSFSYRITGASLLFDQASTHLVTDLMTGLMFAFVIASFIGFLLLRTWSIIPITMMVNIFPVLFMSAIMGMFGMNLTAGNCISFAVALAVVVNGTMHFLTRMKMQIAHGSSMKAAIEKSYLFSGRPLVISMLILLAALAVLYFSNFESLFDIGLLILILVFISLISTLCLLPLLLLTLSKRKTELLNVVNHDWR